jgi:hypothetical protein
LLALEAWRIAGPSAAATAGVGPVRDRIGRLPAVGAAAEADEVGAAADGGGEVDVRIVAAEGGAGGQAGDRLGEGGADI